MNTKIKLNSIEEAEKELEIILGSNCKSKNSLAPEHIFDFLAESIENSIQEHDTNIDNGFFQKIYGKYRLNKVLRREGYKTESEIFGFPNKLQTIDPKLAETRLKTAITAFKLHSGPFSEHPVYGPLDKSIWDKVLGYLSEFMFGYLDLQNDEKLRYMKDMENKKDRNQKDRNYTSNKNYRKKNRYWKNKKKNFKNGGKGS